MMRVANTMEFLISLERFQEETGIETAGELARLVAGKLAEEGR